MSDIVSKVSSYTRSAEQAVLYVTLSFLGASLGLLEGSIKGFQKLQPNFTSREGLEELLYGSNHKDHRGSVTELLSSWVPFLHHRQPDLKREGLLSVETHFNTCLCLLYSSWPYPPSCEP